MEELEGGVPSMRYNRIENYTWQREEGNEKMAANRT